MNCLLTIRNLVGSSTVAASFAVLQDGMSVAFSRGGRRVVFTFDLGDCDVENGPAQTVITHRKLGHRIEVPDPDLKLQLGPRRAGRRAAGTCEQEILEASRRLTSRRSVVYWETGE